MFPALLWQGCAFSCRLEVLDLSRTHWITDAGCATLAAALDSGALPALERLNLFGIPASAAATTKVVILANKMAQDAARARGRS